MSLINRVNKYNAVAKRCAGESKPLHLIFGMEAKDICRFISSPECKAAMEMLKVVNRNMQIGFFGEGKERVEYFLGGDGIFLTSAKEESIVPIDVSSKTSDNVCVLEIAQAFRSKYPINRSRDFFNIACSELDRIASEYMD